MKAAGAALIFLSVFLCGIFAGKQDKDRLCECEAFLELFIYINNSITHFLMLKAYLPRLENDI